MTEYTQLEMILNRIESVALSEFEARFHPEWVYDPMVKIEFEKEFQQLRELCTKSLRALEILHNSLFGIVSHPSSNLTDQMKIMLNSQMVNARKVIAEAKAKGE